MRELLRRIAANSLSLFLVSLAFSGLTIKGGFASYLYAGALLAIFSLLLDPIVKILTLPFNILTLGLLSFLTTLAALFVVTLFYHNVTVTSFTFEGLIFAGLEIKRVFLSGFLSYVVISGTIYFLNRAIAWIFKA